ncbi:MAG: HEPN domain-containing protein [Deltaproteobacteria bacterium]|jgi:HEPN domain-containing protein|nr:HEPN domain-containing protein [Deltaproteobacteria bacterium]
MAKMSKQEKFDHWLFFATECLKVAECLFDADLWRNSAGFCREAIKKVVNGLYILYNDDHPPYLNTKKLLLKFSDKLPCTVSDDIYEYFDEIEIFNLFNWYPNSKQDLFFKQNEEKFEPLFQKTKEVFAWLLTLKP